MSNRPTRSTGGKPRLRRHAVALLAGCLATAPALAQQAGDVDAGRRIAETWCGNCHLTGPQDSGPATDAAPTFASIIRMPSTTAMSLRATLMTPHVRMPDYQLSQAEMDDVIAYMLRLRER